MGWRDLPRAGEDGIRAAVTAFSSFLLSWSGPSFFCVKLQNEICVVMVFSLTLVLINSVCSYL